MSNNTNGDHTKSEYTKTGKKVKSIYDGRFDLTYNGVYDVFIDNKGDEFIIDDVGDKRYWSISDDDYYELVDDNETKHKFKVGDKVKVIDNDYISEFTDNVRVGDIGVISYIGNDYSRNPYSVKFKYSDSWESWWFTDKCIELVANTVDTANNINDNTKTKPKFKVGDKVKVVDVKQFSSWTHDVKVGYVGVVIEVDEFDEEKLYKVKLDKCYKGWWFTDKRLELVSDDTIENDNTTTDETKPKFKVGDKVKVVDIWYISEATSDINVGDTSITGFIISIDDNDNITPYLVKFEDSNVRDNWWFTDKCIELVSDDTKPIESESSPIKSDGGSSSYYAQQIPKGMLERFNATGTIEAKDVIRLFLGNDFNMGNIFKAYCRIISLRNGKGKAGIDEQYDLTKVKYFAEDELNYYLENKE